MKAVTSVFIACIIVATLPLRARAQLTPTIQAPTDSDGDGLIDTEDKCPNQIGPADAGGCPEAGIEMMGRPLVSQTIPFTAGGTAFSSEAEKKLRKLASAIRKGGGTVLVVIEGHADAAGIKADNDKLATGRALAVSDYLTKHGVPKLRITARGRGSSLPVATNDTPEGRGKNRRVEVRVYAAMRQ